MSYPPSTSCGEIGKSLHIIFNNILPLKNNGTFIEIGANDGKTGSFTYNLARMGWNGLNFEPVPRLYKLCCENHKNHKNIKNYQMALGEAKEEATIIDADTLSTIDKNVIDIYSKVPQFTNNFKNNNYHKIKIEKLDNILEQNNITDIDIIILDVEGYEENVLKGFTIEKYNPNIFIIEIADQHPDFINNEIMMNKYKVLRKYFREHNYSLLVNDVVDNVYIHNDIYKKMDDKFIKYIKTLINFPQYKI